MKNVTYINAGAGSGKTYTLTKILAEKLSSKETELCPSQVILTTFTELAASEFREKARQQMLANGNASAAAQMDCAVIGTVHSVAFAFIKKFWYLLGFGAEIQTISDRDANFYMNQSLARIVNEEKNSVHLKNFRRFREVFDICDPNGHADDFFWQKYLNTIVEKMEYYCVEDIKVSVEKSRSTVEGIYSAPEFSSLFGELSCCLQAYWGYIQKKNNAKAMRQGEVINDFLKLKSLKSYDELRPLYEIKKDPVDRSKINDKCPEFAKFSEILESAVVSSSFLNVINPFIESVFTLAKAWSDDFVAYKEKNHLVSFNDMEHLFLQLLDMDEVREYVRSNYRLVMVDEFQDSNPIQLKIFNKLSEIIAESGGESYWVGDPKQAIYGFRGADTDLVNTVSQSFRFYDDSEIHPGEGENNLGTGRLTESWRSRKALVDLVNDVFRESFKKDGINEYCIELKAHFEKDELESPPIVYWQCDEGNADEAAAALAFKVKELLKSNMLVHQGGRGEEATAITPRDIAILCRKNAGCNRVVKALRKLGVPVSETEDAIMQRIEVQLVVNILQFVKDSGNKHVVANLMRLLSKQPVETILRSRIDYLQGLSDGDADEWGHDVKEIRLLYALKEKIRHLPVSEMVRAIVFECNLQELSKQWGDAHIRRQNLSALQHLADDYDRMCLQMGIGASISGFIYYLNSIEPDKEKDNKSNTVKVFTYHTSKGLEWPVVIMCDLDEDVLDDADFTKKNFMTVREIVLNDNATGEDPFAKEYYLHLFPYTLRMPLFSITSKPDPALQKRINALDLYQDLKKKQQSEERRLLYVGMTRAKDYLYTFCHGEEQKWLVNVDIETSPDNVWGVRQLKALSVAALDEPAVECKELYEIVSKPTEHESRPAKVLSPSKVEAFKGYNAHTVLAKGKRGVTTNKWSTVNADGNDENPIVGSCIHDVFAVYRNGDVAGNALRAKNIIEGYGLAQEVNAEEVLLSADWLHGQLQAMFPQREGDLAYNEYHFAAPLGTGQVLSGDMDLLWFYSDDNGRHCVIVDYKTFPGKYEGIDKHVTKYYPQLSAYAHALYSSGIDVTHALVYYPVQECIVQLEKN